MGVNWSKDIDQTLAAAKEQSRPILLDFSAAPVRGACARLDAESYEDQKTAEFIRENFLPAKAHIKEHPAWFHRLDAVWTPTVLLLDSEGKERVRREGYLPNNLSDFLRLVSIPWAGSCGTSSEQLRGSSCRVFQGWRSRRRLRSPCRATPSHRCPSLGD
jgi:hypothetical protein